ncbi:serine/threonine-protein kinase [Streptomyces sp. HMX87]|uniref:serine/threonine-protein kinase n=1 Tax=Streptomyces sp. HMX87 TaxID=3390849 RepID=UPI003A8608DC
MQGRLLAGRYRLGDTIGSGGMGRVWRADDEVLNRAVAVKELTAALYASESDQAILLARTRGEARAAARINHSAVVTVHDVLEHDGRPWIVMELVEGRSLADAMQEEQRVEPREAARIGLWVLRALRAAHTAGVLHRDVKPGNVLLARDGRVLLTDFGIAQIEGDSTITRTGEVVGSVDYLAPERVRGHDPGPASDLWALGAMLYTAVEGRSPFRRTSPLSTMQAVVEEEAGEPRHAGHLAPVIGALLRKDPATRPTAAEAERMLTEAAEGRRPSGAQGHVPVRAEAGDRPHRGPAGPAPYPPVTGRAAVGPTAVGPTAMHPGPAPAPRRRRRLRTVALVAVFAALVGAGTAVVLQKWGPGGAGAPSATATDTATGRGPGGAVPDSWARRDDPVGFSLYLPKDWRREEFSRDGDLTQIDYSPDGGEHFLRIAVDTSPDFHDPHAHQLDLEAQLQRLVDYRRVTLERNVYRDRPGARWEYTWTALAKDTSFPGPRRAIEETYMSRDGVEYALYMSSPAADWETTRRQFTAVLQGWQEKRA